MAYDFMGDVRTWLRTQADLAPLHGGRVVFNIRWPRTASSPSPIFPLIRMYRIGGGLIPGETDVWAVRLGFSIWGGQPELNQAGTFAQVDNLTTTLETVLHTSWQTQITTGSFLASAEPSGAVFSPDPDTGAPRYELTASLVLQQTS